MPEIASSNPGDIDVTRSPSPASKGTAVKKPELTVALINTRYEDGLRSVRDRLWEYWLNHAFILGHQWLFWNPVTLRLDQLPRDADRMQLTVNRMSANFRSIMAKLMQRELQFEVMPTASDDATLRGARIAESALAAIHYDHGWEKKREIAASLCLKGGTAAICVDWDPKLGELIATTEDNQQAYQGDTVETVLSIAEMVVEPGSPDGEKARWWIKAQALPPGLVQATFNLAKCPEADITAGMTPFQAKLMQTSMQGYGSNLVNLTLVRTYYERPNPERPEGAVMVVVGHDIVDGPKPWPFPWKDRLNLVIARETPLENRWVGDTILNQARPIQVALNAAETSIQEHMKQASNARMFVPQAGYDLVEQLTDLPGEIIAYPDGINMPVWSSPPAMPDWWKDRPALLSEAMDDVMGVHDVSRGQAPVNIQSGYGLSVLAEQDASPITRQAKELASMWSKVGSLVLKIYEAEVTDTRTAVVNNPGNTVETARWNGKDLQGQTRATVPLDAVMPRSRAALEAQAEKMMQMGVITEFAQFAQVADLPDQHSLLAAISPDVDRARRENAGMAQGRQALVMEIDDDEIHMREHRNDMKQARFELLHPEWQQMYYVHLQGHETSAAEKAARMAGKAAMAPGLGSIPDRSGTPQPAATPEALAALQESSRVNFTRQAAKATLPTGSLK